MLNHTPSTVAHILNELRKTIVGQDDVIEQVLVAGSRTVRTIAGAAEARAEVYEVVLHEFGSVLLHQAVESIQRLGVVVPQPGREDTESTEVAPVFVRNCVVRVVRTRAVAERTSSASSISSLSV